MTGPHPPVQPGEILLKGGRANKGRVVLIGDQVARPSHPQTATVDAFLAHLWDAGIRFSPEPLGSDGQGRQRLRYIEGTVPKPPYPAWAFEDALLVDVARRQRDLHRAAESFVAPAGALWATSAGDYFPADAVLAGAGRDLLVCHNDLGMSNTVVGDNGLVAGFIDFDYCRPVDRLFDVAVAARHWAPFGNLDVPGEAGVDRVRRFGIFADIHDLGSAERERVVGLAVAFLEKARVNVRRLADGGAVGFRQLIDDGYEAVNVATVQWLVDNRSRLVATA